ncbi:MAG: hypothetical protein U0350_51475 [Caldilineaceae bacterium]
MTTATVRRAAQDTVNWRSAQHGAHGRLVCIRHVLEEACQHALRDLPPPPAGWEENGMNIVAVDRHGNHCGATNIKTWDEYAYMTDDMTEGKQQTDLCG